jgi:hypothetical protein
MQLHGLDKKTFSRKAPKIAHHNPISIGQQHRSNE